MPDVPGAFLLSNFLDCDECQYLISAAEEMKYTPDAVDGIDNVTMIADEQLLRELTIRCKAFLPDPDSSFKFAGINARFRFFRYFPGAVYRS